MGRRIREAKLEVQVWEVDSLLSGAIWVTMPHGGTMRSVFWIEMSE